MGVVEVSKSLPQAENVFEEQPCVDAAPRVGGGAHAGVRNAGLWKGKDVAPYRGLSVLV